MFHSYRSQSIANQLSSFYISGKLVHDHGKLKNPQSDFSTVFFFGGGEGDGMPPYGSGQNSGRNQVAKLPEAPRI